MSKPADVTKLERIRNAAVEIISKQGITNCSVAAIARHADVSIGYLYLHYPGKNALLNDIIAAYFTSINELISTMISENRSLEYIVVGITRSVVEKSASDDGKIRFLITLFNDLSVDLDTQLKNRIDSLNNELILLARKDENIRPDITKTDLFLAMIALPMQYLALRHNQILRPDDSDMNDVDHICALAKKIIFK